MANHHADLPSLDFSGLSEQEAPSAAAMMLAGPSPLLLGTPVGCPSFSQANPSTDFVTDLAAFDDLFAPAPVVTGGVAPITAPDFGGLDVPVSATGANATAMCGVVPTPQPEVSIVAVSTKEAAAGRVRRATTTAAAKANKPHSHQLGIGLSKTTTSRKLPNRVYDNDKRLQDAVWPEHLLRKTAAELNEWLKTCTLSAEQQKELKAARRRMQNRVYQQRARVKRIQKQSALEQEHAVVGSYNGKLQCEVREARDQMAALMAQHEKLVAFLVSLVRAGKVAASDVAGLVEA